MISTVSAVPTRNNIELASWKYHQNDPSRGRVYYVGGYNWDKQNHTGLRLIMNTVLIDADSPAVTAGEVSRSSAIVASVGGKEYQYSGTFNATFPPAPAQTYSGLVDNATFEFPDVGGHFRAVDTAKFAPPPALPLDSGAVGVAFFDVDSQLKAMTIDTSGNGCSAVDGQCRFLFTEKLALSSTDDNRLMLTEGNLDAFKAEFGTFTDPESEFLMNRIHAGKDAGSGTWEPDLGGVDRSTVALVETSPVIGIPRPTVAYFGGLDGMMHAVCVGEAVAPCVGKAGRELWAFMPRTQLPRVASNTTRIDGSPKVSDVFGNFGTSNKEYKTVLTFQAGSDAAKAAYALDITDPTDPRILWVHPTPGAGIGMAMGVVNQGASGYTNISFVQSASGNTTAGQYIAAIETDTGTVLWSRSSQYKVARGQVDGAAVAVADVPDTGIPGGLTVYASDGQELVDTVLAPTLRGSVWASDAKTGNNLFGPAACGAAVWEDMSCTPLFTFVDDYHPVGAPVSIYSDRTSGQLRGAIVTGGFADLTAPTSTTWAPDAIDQYLISFALDATSNDTTLDSTSTIRVNLGKNNGVAFRGFSQAVILGNEIFVASDASDVNSSVFGSSAATGQLTQVNLTKVAGVNAVQNSALDNGAASVDVSKANQAVYTGAGDNLLKTDVSGYDADGASIQATAEPLAERFLWLRK